MKTENYMVTLQKKECMSCPIGHRATKELYDFVKMSERKIINAENAEFLATVKAIVASGYSDEYKELVGEMLEKYKKDEDKELLLSKLYTRLFYKSKVCIGEELRELEKKYTLNAEERQLVERVAKRLDIKGSVIEKFDSLKKIYMEDAAVEEEMELGKCTAWLRQSLVEMKHLKEVVEGWATFRRYPEVRTLLEAMNSVNESFKKYDLEKAKKALKKGKGLEYIMNTYCKNDLSEKVNGHRCDCRIFLKYVDELEKNPEVKEAIRFNARVYALPAKSQEVLWDCLERAPKKWGVCLQMIMDMQEMSANDIAQLIDVGVSTIETWCGCDKPRERDDDKLMLLERALLVSKDVLTKGNGKRYGNWKVLLDDETLRVMRECASSIPPSEIGLSRKLCKKGDVKNFVRLNINKAISGSEKEYEEAISAMGDAFEAEDISCFDRNELFSVIRDKDFAYALLETLESKKL